MPSFSSRYGYTKPNDIFQREEINDTLRIGIWNILSINLWSNWSSADRYGYYNEISRKVDLLVDKIWQYFYKADLDSIKEFDFRGDYGSYAMMKRRFMKCPWYEVYDFIEFLLSYDLSLFCQNLAGALNAVLKKENAAYRIIEGKVVETVDDSQIEAVETAIQSSDNSVKIHLSEALNKLSDREAPDYRNSIKESISAVEALCKEITGDDNATLGKALKQMPELHGALKDGFLKLYGYTSDADGIRHALSGESQLVKKDAMFMLVACSAFVTYLRETASE